MQPTHAQECEWNEDGETVCWVIVPVGYDGLVLQSRHIMPLGDDGMHTCSSACPCGPHVPHGDPRVQPWVHNAYDGREAYERSSLIRH